MMTFALRFLLVAWWSGAVVDAVSGGGGDGGSAASVYQALLNDFAEWKYRWKPEKASELGVRSYDHLLTPYQGEDTLARAECGDFRRRADEMLAAKPPMIVGLEKYYVKLIRRQCSEYEAGLDFGAHLLPNVAFLRGVQSKLPSFFNGSDAFDLKTESDFGVALQRLRRVAPVVYAVLSKLEEGIKRGVTFAQESLSRIGDQFESLEVEDAEDSAFYGPFREMDNFDLSTEFVNEVREAAKTEIENEILPAFRGLHNYIRNVYSKHLRPAPGLLNVPDGAEYYQAALEHHTSIAGLTAQEVHEIGLKEVEKLKEGVKKVSADLNWGGHLSTKEVFGKVQNDPSQMFDSVEDVLSHVRHLIRNVINPKMGQVIPDEYLTESFYSLDVKAVSSGVFAWYQEATPSNPTGMIVMNIGDVKAFKKFELLSLLMHEGIPGHHFDLTVFASSHDFPKFVLAAGPGSKDSIPAQTPGYTAFFEGWALYAEFLGIELGLYKDPYDLLGYYSWNLLRAARLVVDTGLHALGWTRQQTVEYLLENTGLSNYTIQSEVDRYITWPGQATSYKIGEGAIRALRQKKEKELGPAFDLKRFHRSLLPCRGPLDVLEECVELQESLLQVSENDHESLIELFF